MKIAGILLIIAGSVAIFFGGFSYRSESKVPDMGLIQVDDTQNSPVRIPPILGLMGIAAGGGLLFYGRKQRG